MLRGDYQKLIDALQKYEPNVGRHIPELGMEIKTSVIRAIIRHGNIDTTAMVQAIDWHRQHVVDGYGLRVDAVTNNPDVFYDGFVELPRQGWPGSYFYREGIQTADIQGVFDDIARETFV